MPHSRIAAALVGVWTLREYSEIAAGIPVSHPFGVSPKGLLIYTPTGFVSAVLMAPEAERGFIGYSGHYEVDEALSIVTHHPIVAFAPDMVGHPQERRVEMNGDVLVLTARHSRSDKVPPTESRLECVRTSRGEEPAEMTADEIMRIHTQNFYGALKDRNFDALAALYADNYMLVRPDGSVLGKARVIKDLREQGLSFSSIELHDARIRIFGSTAIVTGESQAVSSRHGIETQSRFQMVAVYARDAGGIHLVHFQSTNLAD